jgi:hypothetical protein
MKFIKTEELAVLPPIKGSAAIADFHNEFNKSYED